MENANSKAINAIFCGVSIDEFHRILHVKTAKEAWTMLGSKDLGFMYLES